MEMQTVHCLREEVARGMRNHGPLIIAAYNLRATSSVIAPAQSRVTDYPFLRTTALLQPVPPPLLVTRF